MFEVRCIVGDKKLHEALRALKGHTIEHPVVIPVAEDKAADSGSVANGSASLKPVKKWARRKREVQHGGKHLKGKGSTQVVRDMIARSSSTTVTSLQMKKATIAAGYSSGAYSHAVKLLLADKTIYRLDAFGNYGVNRPVVAPATQTTPASEAIQHG